MGSEAIERILAVIHIFYTLAHRVSLDVIFYLIHIRIAVVAGNNLPSLQMESSKLEELK